MENASKMHQQLVRDVVQRDRRCLDCGSRCDLHAFRIDPRQPLDLDNGRTLCTSCRAVRYATRIKASRKITNDRVRILAQISDLEWRIRCLRDLLQ
jgi:MinD superfamily P-loop ATPase